MGLFDFDFSAVERMFNSMSDEEKAKVMDTASTMMNKMNAEKMAETAKEIQEEEDEISMDEYLALDDDLLKSLSPQAMDALESAVDLERYYEDVDDADQSGAALFYAKAVLALLRSYAAPVLAQSSSTFLQPAMTTLFSYVQAFSSPEQAALFEGDASVLASLLSQVLVFLQRAEYDCLSRNEIDVLKNILLEQNLLRKLVSLQPAKSSDGLAQADGLEE